MNAVGALLKAVPLWLYLTLAGLAVIGYQHLRLESVKASRDAYQIESETANKRVDSLRETARLLRELTDESAQTAAEYSKAKDDAEKKSSDLAAQLRSGAKRLQVNGQCVRAGSAAGQDGREPDGGTFRLTPDAESAYLRLTAGIDLQRAQVIGLQKRVRSLEARCRIGG